MIYKPSQREQAIIFIDKQFERKKSIRIDRVTESATLNQNNYIWLIFTCVAMDTDNTKDDVYKHCSKLFAPKKEITINGVTDMVEISLSEMKDIKQKSVFIDKVLHHWRSEGYILPDPATLDATNMFNEYKQKGWM